MKMGRVVGSVVATNKDPSLVGAKLLVVENLAPDLQRARVMLAFVRRLHQDEGADRPTVEVGEQLAVCQMRQHLTRSGDQ